MVTEEKVIRAMRDLPSEQKKTLALDAACKGIDIEEDIVPFITNVIKGAKTAFGSYMKNINYLK